MVSSASANMSYAVVAEKKVNAKTWSKYLKPRGATHFVLVLEKLASFKRAKLESVK